MCEGVHGACSGHLRRVHCGRRCWRRWVCAAIGGVWSEFMVLRANLGQPCKVGSGVRGQGSHGARLSGDASPWCHLSQQPWRGVSRSHDLRRGRGVLYAEPVEARGGARVRGLLRRATGARLFSHRTQVRTVNHGHLSRTAIRRSTGTPTGGAACRTSVAATSRARRTLQCSGFRRRRRHQRPRPDRESLRQR